jgi:hypothetical protein
MARSIMFRSESESSSPRVIQRTAKVCGIVPSKCFSRSSGLALTCLLDCMSLETGLREVTTRETRLYDESAAEKAASVFEQRKTQSMLFPGCLVSPALFAFDFS